MTYIKIKAEFPCGMKFETVMSRLFGHPFYDPEDLLCPLHGKDCKSPSNVQTRKKK